MSDGMQEIAPDKFEVTDEQKAWQEKVAKYPSLKAIEDMGDEEDFVESHDGREDELAQFIKNHADLEEMKNNPQKVLDAMDEYAGQKQFLIHIGHDKARIVSGLILENKPRVLVELGGYVGYSAILFADQMRGHASDARQVHVWSIEKDEKIATIARDFISLAGLSDYVTVVNGAADESLKKLKEDGSIENIDFLFLDHVEDLYEQDLKVAMDDLKLLKPNSVVVADNVLRPGAPKYREYVRSHPRMRSRAVKALITPGDFEDEIEITKILPDPEEEKEEKSEESKE